GVTHVRVSHRQLIILNTPISKEIGVFFYLSYDYFKNNINSIKYGKIQNDEGN
ncbi:hypothetical protein ANICBIBUN_17864, partial [Acinetobacter nosocomialis 28F]